ncbi:STAS domain-containing protein [Kitasatospora sp. NPDC051853]|uniref:STAS domain-containing protein n=1 Tax=Kitasatospora sp. NPDC051853 TaxID=3364058 RepID=UPI0037AD843E
MKTSWHDDADPDPDLRTEHRPAPDGTVVLSLIGAVDMDTAPLLAHALHRALTGPPAPERLVIDCSGLDFCSSSGLNELLRARRAAASAGVPLRLGTPSPQVLRLLDITGTDTVFEIALTPPAHALSRPRPRRGDRA